MSEEDSLRRGPFDLPRLLRVLHEHGVEHIVVGGVAGSAHGSTSLTDDLDICYRQTQPNVRALARALRALGAVLTDGERVLSREISPRTLKRGDFFIFLTQAGALDCLALPDGTEGYDDLIRNAVTVQFHSMPIRVASLDDLIRMKRATGRPTDLAELAILTALREEVDPDQRRRGARDKGKE